MNREKFGSRLGFLLVSAGCAIGIGNVWRFPYVVGQHGGGVFVLFYLLFLLCMGVPVLTMELGMGRAGRASIVKAYQHLEKPGTRWHIHGWFCLAGAYLLMMYYTTVAGWMLSYFFRFLSGTFEGLDAAGVGDAFQSLKANPGEMLLWMGVIVILGFFVCSFDLQKGLERISKYLMSALLLLIMVLAVQCVFLPGAGEGVTFFLLPDFGRTAEVGFGKVVTGAMNQAFFTLSLGIGTMEIFGSYMSDQHTLPGEAMRIAGVDTFVALMAGMIIFPACFSFGVEPTEGPALIFVTLPNVFANMPGGRLWGALFFLFMTFASFTTVIAVFEYLLSSCMDSFGWSRRRATVINFFIVLLSSVPCILGYNVWNHVRLINGGNILDTEDFLVSNILLPVGSLIFVLFCTTRWGWGYENYMKECSRGEGMRLPGSKLFRAYIRFVLPALILIVFIQGLL